MSDNLLRELNSYESGPWPTLRRLLAQIIDQTSGKVNAGYIADGAIGTDQLADDAVTSGKLADDAVVTAAIADDAVTSAQLADNAVVTAAIADDAITSAEIADNAVVEAAIAAGAVTTAKLGVPKVNVITQTVLFSAFTDGGAAVGTKTLTTQVPAQAFVIFCKVLVTAGFAGDTSCVLTVGDESDADRYNAGTPSIFATAANGVDMGFPSGAQYHSAPTTVKLTATSGADWGSVNAGSITVSLYYIQTA